MRHPQHTVTSPFTLDRRNLLVGLTTGSLLAALPVGSISDTTARGSVRPDLVAQEGAPDTVPLADRWVVPEDLPPYADVTAAALFVGSIASGEVLLAREAEALRAPASTIKIAVALTVVEVLTDLNEVVVVEPEDEVDRWVYSNAQLEAGDRVTVRDLLFGLLLPSGNDAARALARVSGLALDPDTSDPTRTFLEAVNVRAADLGATATTILHPAGVDTEGQSSTARDLALLMAALVDDDLLASIVATPEYAMEVDGSSPRTVLLINTNGLLGSEGVIGGKTGTTGDAGACLVTAVQSGDERVVIVVLGCAVDIDADGIVVTDHRYDDTIALIEEVIGTSPGEPQIAPPTRSSSHQPGGPVFAEPRALPI